MDNACASYKKRLHILVFFNFFTQICASVRINYTLVCINFVTNEQRNINQANPGLG